MNFTVADEEYIKESSKDACLFSASSDSLEAIMDLEDDREEIDDDRIEEGNDREEFNDINNKEETPKIKIGRSDRNANDEVMTKTAEAFATKIKDMEKLHQNKVDSLTKQIEKLSLIKKNASKTVNESLDLLEKQEEHWLLKVKEMKQRATAAEASVTKLTAENAKLKAELKIKVNEVIEAAKMLERKEDLIIKAKECDRLRKEVKELKSEHASVLVDLHKLEAESVSREYMMHEMEHMRQEKEALQNAVVALSQGMSSKRQPSPRSSELQPSPQSSAPQPSPRSLPPRSPRMKFT